MHGYLYSVWLSNWLIWISLRSMILLTAVNINCTTFRLHASLNDLNSQIDLKYWITILKSQKLYNSWWSKSQIGVQNQNHIDANESQN